MSMRSPPSSLTTACTREPLRPTHAPTGSIESSRENTAIFVRLPTSRAAARISTMLCWISGTSSLNSALHEQRIGAAQDEARALRRLLDALEHRANRLALVEVLAMVLLAIRNDRFRLAELVEHDDELAALDLLDLAGEQVADARSRTRRGCAVRSPSRTRWMMRCLAACTAARPKTAKSTGSSSTSPTSKPSSKTRASSTRDLAARVLDVVDDGLEEDDADVALAVVDVDFGLHVRAVLLGERGHDAVLEQPVQLRAIELLGVRQLAKRGENLCGTDHPEPHDVCRARPSHSMPSLQ